MTLSYYRTMAMTLYLGKFQFENKTKKSFSAIDWANFDKLITQTKGVAAMAVIGVIQKLCRHNYHLPDGWLR